MSRYYPCKKCNQVYDGLDMSNSHGYDQIVDLTQATFSIKHTNKYTHSSTEAVGWISSVLKKGSTQAFAQTHASN